MSIEDNKAIVRRLIEQGLAKGNLAIVDELLTDDFVDHTPSFGLPPNRDGFKQSIVVGRSALPYLKCEIEDIIVEGDKVAMRSRITGTHKGELAGIPPTGNRVSMNTIHIFRIAGGRIADNWDIADLLGLMQQIGAVPAPGQE